jgi:pimeloyl-ACP methyl ester carboxylesterase
MPAARTPSPFTWNSVLVDGNWIHYRVAGPEDAPPMVHVHGFAISGSYLMPTAELLADSFRVYVPDLPGFGRSPKPERTLTIVELGTALNHFMDAVGIERAVVVGNSLGCAISAELIDEAPEKVERAVMVGLAGGRHNQPLVRAVGQMALDGLKEPPRMLTVAAPDYLRFGPIRALRLFKWMTEFPAYQRFMSLPVPVMVVIGSEDPLRPSWKRIRAVLGEIPPQVTLVLFQGAAHAINFTHPQELAHAIRQYVAGEAIRMDAAHPEGVPVLELKRPV